MAKAPAEWQELTLPARDPKYAFSIHTIHGTAADDIWIGASAYNLHYDGSTFTPVKNDSGRERAWREVHAVSRTDVWAVGNHASIAHYDGKSWTEQKMEGIDYDFLHLVAFPGEVWITASGPEIHRFDGKSWQKSSPPGTAGLSLQNLWGSSPKDIYFQISKGEDGPPLLVHYDGSDYKSVTVGSEHGAIYGVHGSGPQDVWAVGSRKKAFGRGGQILHFDGKAWTQTPIPVDEVIWNVYAVSPTQAWACGKKGVLLRWDGTRWTQSPTGTSESLGALYAPPSGAPLVAETTRLLRHK